MSPVTTLSLLSHWGSALCLTWTLQQPPQPPAQSSTIPSGGRGVGVPAGDVDLLYWGLHWHFCWTASRSGVSMAGELQAGAGARRLSVLWRTLTGTSTTVSPEDCWQHQWTVKWSQGEKWHEVFWAFCCCDQLSITRTLSYGRAESYKCYWQIWIRVQWQSRLQNVVDNGKCISQFKMLNLKNVTLSAVDNWPTQLFSSC